MSREAPVSAIAACYGLAAFAVAIVSGMTSGREAPAVLESAIIALIVCYVVGAVVAHAANVAIREHVRRLHELEPAPVEAIVPTAGVEPGDAEVDQ